MINRTNSLLFEYIFCHPERKELLLDLVNSIVSPDPDENILCYLESVDRKVEQESIYRGCRFDFIGETSDGANINIEIQTIDNFNIDKMSLFYWAKIYGSQHSVETASRKLKPVYMINILTSNFFHDNDDYINRFHIANMKSGLPLNNQLRLYFLEIPKWTSLSIKSRTRLEKWLTYLSGRNATELLIKYPNDKMLHDAVSAEIEFMSNPDTRIRYQKHEEYILDVTSALYNSKEEGIEKGRKEGREEDRKEEKDIIAIVMIKDGESIEKIKKYTGLTIEEINKLKEDLK